MVAVYDVTPLSQADAAGIRRGDFLISVNGHEINDVLDYSFHIVSKTVKLVLHREDILFDVTIKKREYADIGLEFETYLMDEKRSCRNKCIFCFIDQLPPGMRQTLYFKDDDVRLSFLQGNYVTLTNLSEEDIERIVKMRISPINISVHTTNPELRERMMNNPRAGEAPVVMKRFASAGIKMNCQIVLCKGVNDGGELTRTIDDLAALYPHIQSVSVVPAGLTRYRENLYDLAPFSPEECAAVIRKVERYAHSCRAKHASGIFFCADEFYVKAGIAPHDGEYYEGYPQLENGVGMLTLMRDEFMAELERLDEYDLNNKRYVSIATGKAAYNFICEFIKMLTDRCYNFKCNVYDIENDFFGENITVAGLVTGGDLINQLSGRRLGSKLFLPSVMLRSQGDMFLDGVTPAQLEEALGVQVDFIDNNGSDFIKKLLTE